jgi:hypothetical protein
VQAFERLAALLYDDLVLHQEVGSFINGDDRVVCAVRDVERTVIVVVREHGPSVFHPGILVTANPVHHLDTPDITV